MNRVVLIVMAAMCCASVAFGQNIISGTYTYRYVMSDTETVKQAEVSAVKAAKTAMIAERFGTVVSETTALTIKDDIRAISYGDAEIKGEWLSDNAAPVIRKAVINNQFVLDVTVSGKIREIKDNPIDLKCVVLRNGTDTKYASVEFTQGDKLYLSFKTPVEGYLAVYLGDRKTVNCLFPYTGLSPDIMKVSAGQEYVLFSKDKSGSLDPFAVQECPLGCSPGESEEMVRLYVIFSPNRFTKANDNADGRFRSLPFEEFHTWLSKSRSLDTEMNLRVHDIVIRR